MTANVPATRVIGEVEWSNGTTSRIVPLMHEVNGRWSTAPASDYPPHGKVFWPYSRNTEPQTLLAFTVTEGNGKDHFIVDDVLHAQPVLDYRKLNYADAMNLLRTRPVPGPGPFYETPALHVLCADGILLGPLQVEVVYDNHTRLIPDQQLDLVSFRRNAEDLIHLPDGRMLVIPLERPDGHLDCRSDQAVLRTALEKAAKYADKSGIVVPDFAQTKRYIKEIVATIEGHEQNTLVLEQLRRAVAISENQAAMHSHAASLVDVVLQLPQSVEARRVETSRAAGQAAAEARAKVIAALSAELEEVSRLQARKTALAKENEALEGQLNSFETRVLERVEAAVSDSSELLAESVLLRALGVNAGSSPEALVSHASRPTQTDPFPGAIGTPIEGQLSMLTEAAIKVNAPQDLLTRIHAARLAGLIPVLTGPGAMTALRLYAQIACGGRCAELPVSHDFLHPVDLLGVHAHDPERPRAHGDLLTAARRSVQPTQPGMVVLESFNRGPTESYLLPWLTHPHRQIPIPAAARAVLGDDPVARGEELILAATAMNGSTAAPVSPDLWSYTAVIDAPTPLRLLTSVMPDRSLLKAPTQPANEKAVQDAFSTLPDELAAQWPVDAGVIGAAKRLAQASSRLEMTDSIRILVAECVLLPPLATMQHGPELQESVDVLAKWVGGDTTVNTVRLGRLAHRLQRTFA